jgi:hypothetical protein
MNITNIPRTTQGVLAGSRKIVELPAEDYHADLSAQSCSLLKAMLVSPAHYQAQFLKPRAPTEAMDFGTLVHTLVLEPHRLALNYAVYPGKKDGRDSDYKEFARVHPGQGLIDEVQLHEARTLVERLLHRPVRRAPNDPGRPFGEYLAEGEREASIFFNDPITGVTCRVRVDLLHPEVIFDLKTANVVARDPWLRQALQLHYDMQTYMYSLAVCLFNGQQAPLPFKFLVGESARPYSTSVYTAGESFMKEGAAKYARALGAYAACGQVQHWPDQGEDDTLELDPWMVKAAATAGWQDMLAANVSAQKPPSGEEPRQTGFVPVRLPSTSTRN